MDKIKFEYSTGFTDVYLLAEEENLSNVKNKLFDEDSFFVIDSEVPNNLVSDIKNNFNFDVIKVGETNKSIVTIEQLWNIMFEQSITKNNHIYAVGGGVLTDLVGFAASTFKRGVNFSFIPTTLVCMIDAAHGGKNGVNTSFGKNQIGLINPPRAVICDPSFLDSLNEDEVKIGSMEIIKSGYIFDKSIYEEIFSKREITPSRELIKKTISVKKYFVEQDLNESGERMKLNFGHTLGHLIEVDSDYSISHGEAIAIGMKASLSLSSIYCDLDKQYSIELKGLLDFWEMESEYQFRNEENKLLQYLLNDKKNLKDIHSFETNHENYFINFFFNKKNLDFKGWNTIDIYQNKVVTIISNIKTNIDLDRNIFRIQKYIN